ncbi:EamA family transporter [Mycobacterium sp. 21AC1]|uniref:EamA family transporter n=1 Tax=[Mycobacterium] appelbergii TaxID=2939269 RepID=UPI002938DB1C|nr:EamA family transporter [Mycobacterium sp. 21AC1]MDV3129738.1 EamA family transporter [Mycobacterium sp. 21AC1]
MIGWLCGLGSAVLYGVSDFVGGLASRRAHFVVVALLGQCAGLLVSAAAGPLIKAQSPSHADLWWGALSGLGTAAGMVFLFRGLSRGAMSVIVPTSAVTGILLPVLVGVVVEHERPSVPAWAGIALAVPALWLVSGSLSRTGSSSGGVGDGLIAGIGIAVQYLALAHASSAAGLWPVATGRVSAVGVLFTLFLVLALRRTDDRVGTAQLRMPATPFALATAAGVTAAAALAAYLVATHHQITAIAVVLSSLYPVIPVILGITVLHERLSRRQAAGVVGAGAAIALLAA